MNSKFNKLFLVTASIIISLLMSVSLHANKWDDEVDKRKANYISIEANVQYEQSNYGLYYSLINRAYALDSTDTGIGYEKGTFDIMFQSDSVEFHKAYNLLKKHFDAHPEDYHSSRNYGIINSKLGYRDEAVRVWSKLDSIFPNKVDITMRLADVLSATTDTTEVAKAMALYNRIEAAEGKDIGLISHKIRALSAIRDTVSIISEIDSLIISSPNNSEYHVFAGDIFRFFGDDEKTLSFYNKACELDPSNGNAFLQRALFYDEIGDSVAFDREVFNALKHDDLELESKIELLTQYIRILYDDETQQPRIEELLVELLEQHPHQPEIHELYSAYLVIVKDFPRAAEQLSYSLDIDPSVEESWSQYIALCSQTEDREKIDDAVNRALHYFPEAPILTYQSGEVYLFLGELDLAMDYFRKALPLSEEHNYLKTSILRAIGDIHLRLEQPDSAFAYYEQALNITPDDILTLNNYAYYLAENNKDLDKAESMSAKVYAEETENPTYIDTYAWVFFKSKKYDLAKEYIDKAIEKAIEINETSVSEIYHHAGDIYFMCGDPVKALEYWKEALKEDPDNELLKKKVEHKTFFYE